MAAWHAHTNHRGSTVAGEDLNGQPTGLCVIARKENLSGHPCILSLKTLETFTLECKGFFSPIMVVEAELQDHFKIRFLNTHFHYNMAKKEKGFASANIEFSLNLARLASKYNAHFVAGDFNQSAVTIRDILETKLNTTVGGGFIANAQECVAVYFIGDQPPARHSKVKHVPMFSCHVPIAIHIGKNGNRSSVAAAKRNTQRNCRKKKKASVKRAERLAAGK